MKFRWIIVFALITLLALSACQSTDSTTSGESISADQPSGESQSQSENAGAYPDPNVEQTGTNPYPDPLYPDIQDGEEVEWEQARAMILNGEVGVVRILSESTEVTLAMKDGRLIVVVVTDVMDIHNTITECGETCQNVLIEQD